MKKFLALLLSLMIVMTFMPTVAWADGETETWQDLFFSEIPIQFNESPTPTTIEFEYCGNTIDMGTNEKQEQYVYLWSCGAEPQDNTSVEVESLTEINDLTVFYCYDKEEYLNDEDGESYLDERDKDNDSGLLKGYEQEKNNSAHGLTVTVDGTNKLKFTTSYADSGFYVIRVTINSEEYEAYVNVINDVHIDIDKECKVVEGGDTGICIDAYDITNEFNHYFIHSENSLEITSCDEYVYNEQGSYDGAGYGVQWYNYHSDDVIWNQIFNDDIENEIILNQLMDEDEPIKDDEGNFIYEFEVNSNFNYKNVRIELVDANTDSRVCFIYINSDVKFKYDNEAVGGLYVFTHFLSNMDKPDFAGKNVYGEGADLPIINNHGVKGTALFKELGFYSSQFEGEKPDLGKVMQLDININDGYAIDQIIEHYTDDYQNYFEEGQVDEEVRSGIADYAITNNYYYWPYNSEGKLLLPKNTGYGSETGDDTDEPNHHALWVSHFQAGNETLGGHQYETQEVSNFDPLKAVWDSINVINEVPVPEDDPNYVSRIEYLDTGVNYSIIVHPYTSYFEIVTHELPSNTVEPALFVGDSSMPLNAGAVDNAPSDNYKAGISKDYGAYEIEGIVDLTTENYSLTSSTDAKQLATVTLPISMFNGEVGEVVWFKDDGSGNKTVVPMDTSYIYDNYGNVTHIVFRTNHFSEYGVVSKKETPHYYGGVILPVATKTDATETDVQETTTATDRIIAGVEATKVKAKSKLVKTKSGKKGIKITWTKSKGYKVDYYQILRSTKKNSGYKKVFQTVDGDKTSYINTKNIKKGKTYYYKVRGVRVVDDKEVYTEWSTKAYRKVQ